MTRDTTANAVELPRRSLLRPTAGQLRYLGLGLILSLTSGGAFLFIQQANAQRVSILVINEGVEAGATITDAQLREEEVDGRPGFRYFSPSRRSEVVGETALVRLEDGAVPTESMLAVRSPAPTSERAVVALPVRREQAVGLAAGDQILLVGPESGPDVFGYEIASVEKVLDLRASQDVVVQVMLDLVRSPAVSRAARDGQVSIVRVGPDPNVARLRQSTSTIPRSATR